MITASMATTATSKTSDGLQLIVPGDTLKTPTGGIRDTTTGERGVRNVGKHHTATGVRGVMNVGEHQDLATIATMGHHGTREGHLQTTEGMGITD